MAKRKPPNRTRQVQVTVRVSAEEHEAFKVRASAVGLPVATWLRLLARRAAGLETP
jgi:predicted DNA binding CopG/RHH family protein